MSERRDFLKVAALTALTGSSGAVAATEDGGSNTSAVPIQSQSSTPSAQFSPPIPSPPQEQSFPNYQLHGMPDKEGNLLGATRPKDWHATKRALGSALAEQVDAADPIHNWLRIFKDNFEDRSTSVVIQAGTRAHKTGSPSELRYEPQLYEASLRGASILLDRCLRYRNELGAYEVSGVSAALSYLTFVKLKPLQRNFLIHSNSADLASIEQSTEEFASRKYSQQHGIDRIFERQELQAKAAEAAGAAAGAALAGNKEDFLTNLLEKQFHIQVDAQLAQFTRMLTPGSSSNFAERYLRMMVLFTEDFSDAFCKLYSASKGVQQVLGLKNLTVAMNHPIEVDIPLFITAGNVEAWVNKVVPIKDIAQRKPDVLDALVLWSRAVMRVLEERAQYESEITVSIPLTQPWGKLHTVHVKPSDITSAFGGAAPTGVVAFKISSDSLSLASSGKQIRVVGIGISVVGSQDVASPVQYTTGFPHTPSNPTVKTGDTPNPSQEPTPEQIKYVEQFEIPRMARLSAKISTPGQTLKGGTPYSRPPVFLTNIRIQGGSGGDSEPSLSYDPPCRGLNPLGNWTVAFDPNIVAFYQSISPVTDIWIAGLILHLRLRATYA